MPPDNRVNALAKFNAKTSGIVIELPKSARFQLTGDTLTEAIKGFPTLNCHQGTNIEIAINRRVDIPATKPMMLILFCITSTYNAKGDVANINCSAGLNCYAIYIYFGIEYVDFYG